MEKMVAVNKRYDVNSQLISCVLTKQDHLVFPVRIGSRMANIEVFVEYEEENGKKQCICVFVSHNGGVHQGSYNRDWDDDKVSLAVQDVVDEIFDEEKSSYRREIIKRISNAVVLYCRNNKIIGVR